MGPQRTSSRRPDRAGTPNPATAIVASYALELRIEGKTVWFQPVVDDDADDDVEATQAPLVDKKINQGGTDYGATEDIQQKA